MDGVVDGARAEMSVDLDGWVVVVTRAEGDNGPLGAALERHGAEVLRVPTVAIGAPADRGPLDRALAAVTRYDWIVFTSPRAVDAVADHGVALPADSEVAAVGSSTAARAAAVGIPVSLVGEGRGAREFAEELVARGVGSGARVLFPASSRARADLVRILVDAGALVDQVVAYETRVRSFDPATVPALARADVITFTSPSAAEGWHAVTGGEPMRFLADGVRFVAIGGTTEEKLKSYGVSATVAPEASLDGVVAAVCALRAHDRAADGGGLP